MELTGTLERTNMRSFTLVLAAVAVMAPIAVDAAAFRCGFLSFLGSDWACRQSCKVQGHVSNFNLTDILGLEKRTTAVFSFAMFLLRLFAKSC